MYFYDLFLWQLFIKFDCDIFKNNKERLIGPMTAIWCIGQIRKKLRDEFALQKTDKHDLIS